jgi:hypothetical protein
MKGITMSLVPGGTDVERTIVFPNINKVEKLRSENFLILPYYPKSMLYLWIT